jgi:hypothetical protein
MREEGKKKKKTAHRERDESERREKKKEKKSLGLCKSVTPRRKKKEAAGRLLESRVFFFFFLIYAYAGQCGAGRISAGKKMCLPATRPAPHGLDKIQPESVQKHSKSGRIGADRGGSVRFCGLGGFLPSPK